MYVSPRACRHCGSPAKGNPCWWVEDRRISIGADSPCSCDQDAAESERRERRVSRGIILSIVGVIAVISFLLYIL